MGSKVRSGIGCGSVVFGVLFGGIFFFVGLWIHSTTQPLDDGVIVAGIVVDVDERTDSDGDRTYAPIVDYVDPATGTTHRIEGSVGGSSRPTLGSSREVSLRPGEPSSARVVGPAWFGWLFMVIGAAVPVSLLAVPLLLRRAARRVIVEVGEVGDGDHNWTIESHDGVPPTETPVSSETATPTRRPGAHRPPIGVTQPGYHPDPDDDGRIRYWDGTAWTDMYAPVLFED